jgi:ArsR family transcriptional regulator
MTQRKTDKDNSKEVTPCCSSLAELLSPRLFKALADPKRLSLLVRVAEEGCPCTVSHVAEGSGVDMSVVSRHLAILREAGIIKCEKQGKEVLCTLQTDVVSRVLRQLADALDACCPGKGLQEQPGNVPSPAPCAVRPSRRKQP